jgi:hypothetical protein
MRRKIEAALQPSRCVSSCSCVCMCVYIPVCECVC